jgi:hypothetical protein
MWSVGFKYAGQANRRAKNKHDMPLYRAKAFQPAGIGK